MIQTVKITTVEDLMPLMSEQEYRPELKRNRSGYLYRGMPDSGYKMATSLSRCCKDKQQRLEPAILNNFAKYAVREDPTVAQNVWYQMITGQHNGLPTRLLDWTHSSLVALHFATTENDLGMLDRRDCAVWRIDVRELNKLLPQKYRHPLETERTFVFSVAGLNSVVSSLTEYDRDMGDQAFVSLEPPSVDQRIINQYSFFTVIPSGIESISAFLEACPVETIKYVIDKKLRWQLRDVLDQFNVNERIMYPGLDGLSRWIARHYYKKR